MKKYLLSISLGLLIFTGCGSDSNSNETTTTQAKTAVIESIPDNVMLNYVKAIDSNATVAFGYKAVKLIYPTKDAYGNDVNASGVLIIPEANDAIKAKFGGIYPISIVCDNHGTIFRDSEAPSNTEIKDSKPNLKTAIIFTGYAGFATVMPDYIGYGSTKGDTHPYIMTKSAQASVDMIKAAAKYLKDNNYTFTNDVYITGYSEGGYVAMATAKQLQDENTTFNIKGVTPMAGPYDVELLANIDLNTSLKMVYPAFLAYVADSYSKIYNLDLNEMVNKPEVFEKYDLFGGDYDAIAIHYYLGLTNFSQGDYGFYSHYPNELFKSSFINDFYTEANNTFRLKLKENGVFAWKPNMPMNIINCIDDEIIPYVIAQEANATMNKLGAKNVTLTPIPSNMIAPKSDEEPFVHQRCAPVAYGVAAKYFTKIRGY